MKTIKEIRERQSLVCELFFGELKTISEIAEGLHTDKNRTGRIVEEIMFFKKFDEHTADELEVLTFRSMV